MAIPAIFPEMAAAAFSLLVFMKARDAAKELRNSMADIKALARGAAGELFTAYLELRAKDGEVLAFMCEQPAYSRCDDNVWHGALDAKLAASRSITTAMMGVSRYDCGKKRQIINQGLTNYIESSGALGPTAQNYEYALEDLYFEQKNTALVKSALGSPSSLIDSGFRNAGDIYSGIERLYSDAATGGAAGFGVFSRRALGVLKEQRAEDKREAEELLEGGLFTPPQILEPNILDTPIELIA